MKATKRHQPRGFALVVAITMMLLLALLAVGLLSLSTVTLRSAQNGAAMAQARSNARVALAMAIGELQKSAGADTRITADADLVDVSTPNPHWTGVWKTRPEENLAAGEAGEHVVAHHESERYLSDSRVSRGRFSTPEATNWLVSSPEPGEINPDREGEDSWVTLLASDRDEDRVRVPRVSLGDNDSYAWWVADESQKARLSLPDRHEDDTARYSTVAAQDFDFETMSLDGGQSEPLAGLDTLSPQRLLSVASLKSAGLLDLGGIEGFRDSLGAASHHVTTHSQGLFVDVKRSGLKRDLTPFLARGDIGSSNDLEGLSERDPILAGDHHRETGPRFGMLKGWADLASQLSSESGEATIAPQPPNTHHYTAAQSASGPVRDLTDVSKPAIQPVVVEASLGWDFSPYGAPGSETEFLRGHIYPRLILWNPYNVTLEATEYVAMLRHPHYSSFEARGETVGSRGDRLHFADLCGQPAGAFLGFVTRPTELAPGETKIFTPDVDASSGAELFGTAAAFDPENYDANVLTAEQIPGVENFYYDTDVELPPATNANQYAPYGFSADLNSFYASEGYSDEFIVSQAMDSASGSIGWDDATGNSEDFPRVAHFLAQNWGTNRYSKWYAAETNQHPSNNGTPFREFRPGAPDIGPLENRNVPRLWRRGIRMAWFDDEAEYIASGENVPKGRYTVPWIASSNLRGGLYHHGNWVNIPFNAGWQFPASDSHLYFRQPTDPQHLTNFFPPSPFAAPDDGFPSVCTIYDIPRSDTGIISMGQLQHAQLSYATWHPSLTIGHSRSTMNADLDATAIKDRIDDDGRWEGSKPWEYDAVIQTGAGAASHDDEVLVYDLAFEANEALWDRYMISSIPYSGDRPRWDPEEPLPVGRYVFNDASSRWSRGRLSEGLSSDPDMPHRRAAEFLVNQGAFNVNSTSVQAWKALLGSMRGLARESLDGGEADGEHPLSRSVLPKSPGRTSIRSAREEAAWNSFRSLSDDEIEELSRGIVDQVRERGPFLSLADFVNRRLIDGRGDTARSGALDQAIEEVRTLNRSLTRDGRTDNREIGSVETAAHRPGAIAYGLPGYLTQGDLLTALAPAITARGDTFTIRAYGEAKREDGSLARAWCEAVVQRGVDYIDPADDPARPAIESNGTDPSVADLSPTNLRFGRRFRVASFRWLSPSELQS